MVDKQVIPGAEAPTSVTYSITSKDGFNALFTIREVSVNDLLQKMGMVEAKLIALQYKPQVRGFGQKPVEYVEGKVCPKCGGRLVVKQKKDGSPFHKCERGKYNSFTKQNEGCDFIDWLNVKKPANPYSQQTIPVEEYEG